MIAVGVDAGATSTVAALSREGVFVRDAVGPGGNATIVGVDDAADAMLQAIRRAAQGLLPDAIYIGAAGAGRSRIADPLAMLVCAAYPRAVVRVGDDTAIALRGAIPQGPGVVVIAGTGSVAYAENGERRARVGGYGYLVGDEGSGYAIGMAAVRAYTRVLDGRAPRDEVTDHVVRTLAATDRATLLAALYDGRVAPSTPAALAPGIIALADGGDRAATKIVQQAALDIAELVRGAARAVGLLDANPVIALAGGLLQENSVLTFLIETRINGDIAGATIVRRGDAPVRGALRLAESLAGAHG
jgi:N-acetylglucosamine kinase-like BadF-type ATPase